MARDGAAGDGWGEADSESDGEVGCGPGLIPAGEIETDPLD